MRRAWGIVAIAVLTTGCGWLQPGFDPGRSRANPLETGIGLATVSQLTHHTIPNLQTSDQPVGIVVGSLLVGTYDGKLTAFDRGTCPTPSNAACTPAWTTASYGALPASDGSTIFSVVPGFGSDGENRLEATHLDGTPAWSATFPYAPSTDNPFPDELVVSGGWVLVGLSTYDHGSNRSEREIEVLPAAGCGAPTCTATRTIATVGTTNFVASDTTLFAFVEAVEGGKFVGRIRAIDVTTGATSWRSAWRDGSSDPQFSPAHGRFIARDDVVSFHQYETRRTDIYPIDGSGCGGTPTTCSRLRTLDGTGDPGAASARTMVTEGERLAWYDATGGDCSGSPVKCPRRAVTVTGAQGSTTVLGIADGVVYAAIGTRLLAYDEAAAQGCTGAPRICTPVWTYDFGTAGITTDFSLWAGHIYVTTRNLQTGNNTQHVFSLPS